MFSDSDIAKSFKCGEKKTAYIASYGLAPFFKNQIITTLNNMSMPYFVHMFDESLCDSTHSKQMDCHVRFWDNIQKCVITRYLGAQFMGHGNAGKLLEHFVESLKGLKQKNILQISMDGPNVNWKFYRDMCRELFDDPGGPKPVELGSCGLHIVHGAFKYGCTASEWDLKSVLWSMYQLLKDSPARREDYESITSSTMYPLKFCAHRWVENVTVAQRAIDVLPAMKVYVDTLIKEKRQPKNNKLFSTVKEAVNDVLFYAKLHFFLSVAKQFQEFLKVYQTDRPMVPFLRRDLDFLLRGLMKRCIASDVLEKATSTLKLTKISVSQEDNLLNYKKVDVGFQADKELKTLVVTKQISEREYLQFRMSCKKFLVKCVEKLLDKSPLSYSFVRSASAFDPNFMVSNQEESLAKLKRAVSVLNNCNRVADNDCDDVIWQYQHFVDNVVKTNEMEFRNFSHKNENLRLDNFFVKFIDGQDEYNKLWTVIKMVLVLSHGQATVERGFSINKQVLEVNMQRKSLEAQRIICDEILYRGGILKVPMTKPLLLAVSASRSKYQQDLERKREEKNRGEKRKEIQEELDKVRQTKKQKVDEAKSCISTSKDLAEEAERCDPRTAVLKITQSNALRRRADILTMESAQLDHKIAELKKNAEKV